MTHSPTAALREGDVTVDARLPRLSSACAPLTRCVSAVNAWGETVPSTIPCERALTVYVDKREVVTLMTLGMQPELLVMGYLRNQRLVQSVGDVESITVDWDTGAAAVKTRSGIADLAERMAQRVITTGCGQGSVFASAMDAVDRIQLPASRLHQRELYALSTASACRTASTNKPGRCTVAPCSTEPSCWCLWRTWDATTPWTPLPAGWACTAWMGRQGALHHRAPDQ